MASRKKGLSIDGKRAKMLELFYESEEVFQMKELEKIAPKKKGVISQSVKEITQMLVDDGLVECEKIGTFVCYWAFPSKALQTRKRKLNDIEMKIRDLEEKITLDEVKLEKLKQGKEDSDERINLLSRVAEVKQQNKDLEIRLEQYAVVDPKVLEIIRLRTEQVKEDANRWTDNIISIKKWCKIKFGIKERILDTEFEIPEDLDYVD